MSKPNYRVTLTFDSDRKVFLARAPELEHCSAEGPTRAEAIAAVEHEIDAQLANMLSHGGTPPRSVDEEELTGELSVKVSKSLHRELAWQARSEGLEISHVVGELLAAALEGRKGARGPRAGNRPDQNGNHANGNYDGNRRQGFGGRGQHLLDDRASFIEYVRGIEQQQGQGGGHARGPHSGGPHGGQGGPHGGQGGPNGRGRRGGRGGRGSSGGGGFRSDGRPDGRPDGRDARPQHGGPQHGRPQQSQPSEGNGQPPRTDTADLAPRASQDGGHEPDGNS